jgi:TolB-like protein
VAKCLEKRPGDRFDSAHDLSLTLSALDTSASVPPPPQEASFLRRRWPHMVAVAVAVVIAVLFVFPPQGLFERTGGQTENLAPRSIAVLPLENLTGDPEQQYLVDGLHEELISTLARISAFDKVIARTSVMGFRASDTPISSIAKQLDVSLVIEGAVRRSENTVHISINLVDAASESHLWGDTFERDLGDALRLQGDITRAISREVQLVLTPGEESRLRDAAAVNVEAQDAYYRALFRLRRHTEEDFSKAVELLEYSLSIDRDFAPAYAAMAETFTLLGNWGTRPPAVMEQARNAASRALEIDDRVASAHVSLAAVLALIDRDWKRAEGHLAQALEIEPNSAAVHTAYSRFHTQAGFPEQAIDEGLRAIELDPLDLFNHRTLGQAYYFCRRYGEAADVFERVLGQRPDYAPALYSLLLTVCATGDRERAMDVLEELVQAPGGWYWVSPELIEELRRVRREADFTAVAACRARQLESMARERYVSPALVATVHATAGNGPKALEWLERADAIRDPLLAWTYRYADFDFLRSDSRFRELVARMNYPVEPL